MTFKQFFFLSIFYGINQSVSYFPDSISWDFPLSIPHSGICRTTLSPPGNLDDQHKKKNYPIQYSSFTKTPKYDKQRLLCPSLSWYLPSLCLQSTNIYPEFIEQSWSSDNPQQHCWLFKRSTEHNLCQKLGFTVVFELWATSAEHEFWAWSTQQVLSTRFCILEHTFFFM